VQNRNFCVSLNVMEFMILLIGALFAEKEDVSVKIAHYVFVAVFFARTPYSVVLRYVVLQKMETLSRGLQFYFTATLPQ